MRVAEEREEFLANRTLEPPRCAELHVWAWHLSPDARTLAKLEGTLSVDEWQRVRRFRSHLHARRFVARRGTTRLILGKYLNLPAQELQFVYGPQGKPALAQSLCETLEFNVADSSELAVLAVGTDHPLGIDVERLRPIPDAEELAAHAFAGWEVEHLKRATASRRAGSFFELWTRREALAKAKGHGLRMSSALFAEVDAAENPRRQLTDDVAKSAGWHVYALPAPSGYVGALATSREVGEIVYCALSPALEPVPCSPRLTFAFPIAEHRD